MAVTKIAGKNGAHFSAREFWEPLNELIKQDYGKEKMSKWVTEKMDYYMKLSVSFVISSYFK